MSDSWYPFRHPHLYGTLLMDCLCGKNKEDYEFKNEVSARVLPDRKNWDNKSCNIAQFFYN
ncbi:MAG: hypothetical protein WBI53_04610 [Paludibacter sp.]